MVDFADPRLPARFWAKVVQVDECWHWTGYLHEGYGRFRIGGARGRTRSTHRYAYETLVGPIPEGLDLDHLCRLRSCCNPAHMEPVTRQENVRRGLGGPGMNARKTHCHAGHQFTAANTRITSRGWRECRTCDRDDKKRLRAEARAANLAL